jgi:tetratricopeptide (TPR) repeat protein
MPSEIRLQRRRAGLCLALAFGLMSGAATADDALGPPLPPFRPQTPPTQAVPPKSDDADARTYERCLRLAKTDPAAARDLAEGWHDRGGAHPADHCFAVALVGLKQYKPAAQRFETLAKAMIHAPASLRAEVLDQAAQAWLLAGDPGRAYAAGGEALKLAPGDPDLLVDRAEAAGSAGWYDKAIADLDQVLKGSPRRVDALIYRASAYRALGKLDPAAADIDQAVALAPNSVDGLLERGNIRRLRGDLAGARQDWLKVSMLAPGSAADAAAKDNIERLDVKSGAPPPRR